MRRVDRFRGRISVLACAFSFWALPALAQPAASAEKLFQEGRQALLQNRLEEARTKLEASQKADPAAGTLLNLAECYEKLGLTATAYDTYTEARDAAQKRGRADWEKLAADRISALAPRLPRLRITGKVPSTASVLLDGRLYDRAAFGKANPIDPGTHRLTVIDNSRELFVREVVAKEGATSEIVVDIPEAAPQPHPPVPGPAVPPPPPPIVREQPPASTGPSPFVWVLGGVSLASFGAGAAFMVVRNGQAGDTADEMKANGCVEGGTLPANIGKCADIRSRGEANLMSVAPQVIGAVAGGVFAVSAIALYFATTGSSSKSATGAGRVRAMCLPGIGGGACVVQF